MMNGSEIGKMLILLGMGVILLGLVVLALSKYVNLGSMPGDIFFQGEHGSFYFPVVSCIIISIVLSILMNLFH